MRVTVHYPVKSFKRSGVVAGRGRAIAFPALIHIIMGAPPKPVRAESAVRVFFGREEGLFEIWPFV